ncbi:hypothetical protein HRbin14_01957 [bacterium HR14]|nr:hypothetical protein HRbin14_01957 [bacterium HR14]
MRVREAPQILILRHALQHRWRRVNLPGEGHRVFGGQPTLVSCPNSHPLRIPTVAERLQLAHHALHIQVRIAIVKHIQRELINELATAPDPNHRTRAFHLRMPGREAAYILVIGHALDNRRRRVVLPGEGHRVFGGQPTLVSCPNSHRLRIPTVAERLQLADLTLHLQVRIAIVKHIQRELINELATAPDPNHRTRAFHLRMPGREAAYILVIGHALDNRRRRVVLPGEGHRVFGGQPTLVSCPNSHRLRIPTVAERLQLADLTLHLQVRIAIVKHIQRELINELATAPDPNHRTRAFHLRMPGREAAYILVIGHALDNRRCRVVLPGEGHRGFRGQPALVSCPNGHRLRIQTVPNRPQLAHQALHLQVRIAVVARRDGELPNNRVPIPNGERHRLPVGLARNRRMGVREAPQILILRHALQHRRRRVNLPGEGQGSLSVVTALVPRPEGEGLAVTATVLLNFTRLALQLGVLAITGVAVVRYEDVILGDNPFTGQVGWFLNTPQINRAVRNIMNHGRLTILLPDELARNLAVFAVALEHTISEHTRAPARTALWKLDLCIRKSCVRVRNTLGHSDDACVFIEVGIALPVAFAGDVVGVGVAG